MKHKQNIYFFISAIGDFNIPSHITLPTVEEIYNETNTIRLVECIEALALYLEADPNYVGPVMDQARYHIPRSKSMLKFRSGHEPPSILFGSRANFTSSTCGNITINVESSGSPSNGENIKEVEPLSKTFFGSEKSALHEKQLILVQSLIRGRTARECYHKHVRDAAYRAKIAKEIYQTEVSYVNALQIIMNIFMEPLKTSADTDQQLLNKQQFKSIFSEIEVISAYAQTLLRQLEPRIENWSPQQSLGDIFINITHFLKVYTQYVKDHDKRIATVNLLKSKNPHFVTFLEECSKNPEIRSQDLKSYLIHPIQRIPRYMLLLNEMVKHTPAEHRDYRSLVRAATEIRKVATYVNDRKEEAETIWKVVEVEKCLVGLETKLSQPHRRFVKEGLLEDMSERKEIMLYLFNDIIIVATPIDVHRKRRKTSKSNRSSLAPNLAQTETLQIPSMAGAIATPPRSWRCSSILSSRSESIDKPTYKTNQIYPLNQISLETNFKDSIDLPKDTNLNLCFQLLQSQESFSPEVPVANLKASCLKEKTMWCEAIATAISNSTHRNNAFENNIGTNLKTFVQSQSNQILSNFLFVSFKKKR
eukprot:TRINITY_DN5723_c0_g1_i2.p1 TRINITY_DN5723_c0_g1~~TRINITY_DN5723_c0_g1_i2.p1  ORF type:complete len:678 (+),score=96.17 TRINITY_DN5723_c0_g1_i2:266-2035(+)